jgi:hypothetical protein
MPLHYIVENIIIKSYFKPLCSRLQRPALPLSRLLLIWHLQKVQEIVLDALFQKSPLQVVADLQDLHQSCSHFPTQRPHCWWRTRSDHR